MLLFSGHPTLGSTLGHTGPGRCQLVLRRGRHRLGYKGIGWQVKARNNRHTPVRKIFGNARVALRQFWRFSGSGRKSSENRQKRRCQFI